MGEGFCQRGGLDDIKIWYGDEEKQDVCAQISFLVNAQDELYEEIDHEYYAYPKLEVHIHLVGQEGNPDEGVV